MRSLLESEHDSAKAAERSRDLVLGMPALLGIFLGVALVCAACFGFGYRSSRDFHLPERHLDAAHTDAAPLARRALLEPRPLGGSTLDASGQEAESPETAYPTPAPEQVPEQSEAPAAVAQAEAPPVPALRSKPSPSAGVPRTQRTLPDDASTLPTGAAASPVAREQTDTLGVPLPRRAPFSPVASVTEPVASAAGAGAMVQIAAVTRAADAQTLASALRHDGFDAIVRTSTDDRFFHIQIGPFPSLQAAKTMRSKLADNGYNAFIKP